MTDFNQSDLRLAKLFAVACYPASEEMEAAKRIIASLPDPAPLTMTDIEWDQDTHYLMEAEHPRYGKVVMTGRSGVRCQLLEENREDGFPSGTLTPTGRKYKLVPEDEAPPALPEGMRLADHEVHGRVVVSSKPDEEGDYKIHGSECRPSIHYWPYAKESDLTFVDTEPVRTLTTEQHFKDAPVVTIVKHDLEVTGEVQVAVKNRDNSWTMDSEDVTFSDAEMVSYGPWVVLE